MKIYPSIHVAKEVDRPKFLDIPVSHIEKNYIPTSVETEIEPEFAHASSSYLAPYQTFDTNDFLIFEDDGSISDAKLSFQNGNYVYVPKGTAEFSPTKFFFKATLQRNTKVHGDRNYDFRIGFYDQHGAKAFVKKMMPIFSDAPYRGMAPSNITVNGASTDIDKMIQSNGDGLDFLFVQGSTDEFFKDTSDGSIPYEKLFKDRANIWLTLSDIGYVKWFQKLLAPSESYMVTQLEEEGDHFIMKRKDAAGRADRYATKHSYCYKARMRAEFKMFPRAYYKYIMQPTQSSPDSPIFILQAPSGQYIIISHEELFEHLDLYSPFIYDVLSRIYERSYVLVSSDETWFADEAVDYLGSLNVPFHRNHPVVNLNDVIAKSGKDIEDYKIINLYTNQEGIIFDHADEDGNVYFKKTDLKKVVDPQKQLGDTSIFTYKHTILQYPAQKRKTVESDVKITTSIENGRCYFTVFPFSSSKHKLLLKTARTFEIEDVEKPYILYALPVREKGESEIGIVQENDPTYDTKASVRIARIWVEFIGEPVAYDIRQLGGGLPSTYTDYDMLDVGNLKGRPYRVGVGAVIKLPKAYQKYADKIQKAIESYKVAADQFYVVYE